VLLCGLNTEAFQLPNQERLYGAEDWTEYASCFFVSKAEYEYFLTSQESRTNGYLVITEVLKKHYQMFFF
jgi:hypothetical protein